MKMNIINKKIAINQSNYIPWKGYFDMIAAVDEFILYDDMQYTINDWRNRNQIKTPYCVQWLTVPVGRNTNRRIRDVTLSSEWQIKHWKTLHCNYRRAPYFYEVASWLEPMYMNRSYNYLSQMNRSFIEAICNYLDIKTVISNCWDYKLREGKNERLADLCSQAGATEFILGPAANKYIEESVFSDIGIKVTWFNYADYPEYPQLYGDFIHGVTILDLLFNCGKKSPQYMRYVHT
ncbi:MAG: WbqC family protein [Chlorobiaceae bacterium]